MRMVRYLPGILLAAAIIGVPVAYAQWRERDIKNFRVVQDRVLYRSAQLTPLGLERVIHDYGIKTVISFRYAEPEKGELEPPDAWEEPLCARLGVNYVRIKPDIWVSLDGGPIPADKTVAQFLSIVKDPTKQPVLVHCFRGAHRTGSYCALFRMDCQGWNNADAIAEMKALGYDNIDKEDDVRGYLERYQPRFAPKAKP
jgi:tyrosine-protein phosphatase SIW14